MELVGGMVFEGFEHGEQGVEAMEESRGGDGGGSFHLSSGKADEEGTSLVGECSLGAHEAPSQGAGLTGNQ